MIKNIKFKIFVKSALFFASIFSYELPAMENQDDLPVMENQDQPVQRVFSVQQLERDSLPLSQSLLETQRDVSQSLRIQREESHYERTSASLFSSQLLEIEREESRRERTISSLISSSLLENQFSQNLTPLRLFQQEERSRLFSFEQSPMAGGPPPDPLERYRLLIADMTKIRQSGNFRRGNIQSFLENMRPYWERYSRDYFSNLLRPDYSSFFNLLRPIRLPEINLEGLFAPIGPHNFILAAIPDGAQAVAAPAVAQREHVDLENVMRTDRMLRTKKSIDIIYSLLKGTDINEDLCIQEFRLFLEHLQKSSRYPSFVRANKMNEIDNAFFTLERSRHPRDYDSILLEDAQVYMNLEDGTPVTMKSLLAKTWWLTQRQFKEKQQEILKESLVRALGQCIEDDGHRTCNVGKSQRITTVLQGYIEGIKTDDINIAPEPDIFLSAFFSSKEKEITSFDEKSAAEKRQYGLHLFEEIKTAAEEVYKETPDKAREVLEKTKVFLRLSLDIDDM